MFWCETHQCWKTRHYQKLCQTRKDYRALWDAGRGPGQTQAGVSGKHRTPSTARRLTNGVGDYLKKVTTELGLTVKQGCNCKSLAAEMNRLGPDGCRRDRARLVEALQVNAKRYTWGDVAKAAAKALMTGLAWRIDLTDPYGSLLDEAIRRVENTEKEG